MHRNSAARRPSSVVAFEQVRHIFVDSAKRARADARERRCRRQPSVVTLLPKTELQSEFPLHVLCSYLGNSPRIAQQSHLLVAENDFAKAERGEGDGGRGNFYGKNAPVSEQPCLDIKAFHCPEQFSIDPSNQELNNDNTSAIRVFTILNDDWDVAIGVPGACSVAANDQEQHRDGDGIDQARQIHNRISENRVRRWWKTY